jgi:hypothetical protein
MEGVLLRQRVAAQRDNRDGRDAGPLLEPLDRVAE